jgi:hypothetical protein
MKSKISRKNLDKIYDIIVQFRDEHYITCEETIYQSDEVIENAYDFICDLMNIVGYNKIKDDE